MNEIIGESSTKSSVCGGVNNKTLMENNKHHGVNDGEGISATVAKVLQDYDWSVVPMVTK